MAEYRGAVIGLGWMGMLSDIATRDDTRYNLDDPDRPMPTVDIHRRIHHHDHPGSEGQAKTYCGAMWDRPEVQLVAGADRDAKRLKVFTQRYGVDATYTDAAEMLTSQKPDIVAVATNVKGRADLTCLAVECGAKAIVTEKPMAHTLAEADRMVHACAQANVPLCCGQISTIHPSFGRARQLLTEGAIGELISIEALGPYSQHQNWSYFLDTAPAWVVGTGDPPRREGGSDEFEGSGMLITQSGLVVHFRRNSTTGGVRLSGTSGQMLFSFEDGWQIWQDIETGAGKRRVEMPWPDPQFRAYGPAYCLADVLDCLAGKLDEPKNSGRRVRVAIEVEIALKQSSANHGARVDLPLADRSPGLNYDWFR